MSHKVVINLKKPMPPSDDCLPHAAMTLGFRGNSMRPTGSLVSRLVIQESMGQWYLYRMDASGGFVGDSSHPTKEDALATAKKEFALTDDQIPS